jgi:hypothetical protein
MHELKRTRILMELNRAEGQVRGKTPAQVLELYSRAKDTDTIRFVIESQARTGWPDVTFSAHSDPGVLAELQKAIRAAQQQRLATVAPELLAAQKRLAKVRGSATLASLFDHLRRGRGIATAPKPRPFRVKR